MARRRIVRARSDPRADLGKESGAQILKIAMGSNMLRKSSKLGRVGNDASGRSVRQSERTLQNRDRSRSEATVRITRQQHFGLGPQPQRFGAPKRTRLAHTPPEWWKGHDMRSRRHRYGLGPIGAAVRDNKDAGSLGPKGSDCVPNPLLLVPGRNHGDRGSACHPVAIGVTALGVSTSIR